MTERPGWAKGSVYRQAGRSRWTAALPFPDPITGERRVRTQQVDSEAQGWALIESWRGLTPTEHHAAVDGPRTFRELAGLWLTEVDPHFDRSTQPGRRWWAQPVSDPTWRDYESVIATHLLSTLGSVRLDELSTPLVQDFLDGLPRRKSRRGGLLSPDRVVNVYRRLWQVLQYGVLTGALTRHPMLGMKPPAPARRSMEHAAPMTATERALTVDEVDAMLAWAGEVYSDHPDYRVRLRLGAETGMRQAEVCGLTWDRVDLKRRTITVWQVLTQVPHTHGCSGDWGGRGISPCTVAAREATRNPSVVIPARSCPQRIDGSWVIDTDTKAHRQRRVPITTGLAADLKALHEAQHPAGTKAAPAEARRLAGVRARARYDARDADLVFRSERSHGGGWWISKSLDNHLIHRGMEAAAIPAAGRTVHALRHTAATSMIRAGIPLPEVQRILGHSSLTVLQRYYGDATTSTTAADLLDAHLAAARDPESPARLSLVRGGATAS